MELSPAALAVLKKYKQGFEASFGEMLDLPLEECVAVHESERVLDAVEHAEWAAERLVELLSDKDRNVEYELRNADLWAFKILRKGYLVQESQLRHAYEKALELAVKGGRDRGPNGL